MSETAMIALGAVGDCLTVVLIMLVWWRLVQFGEAVAGLLDAFLPDEPTDKDALFVENQQLRIKVEEWKETCETLSRRIKEQEYGEEKCDRNNRPDAGTCAQG